MCSFKTDPRSTTSGLRRLLIFRVRIHQVFFLVLGRWVVHELKLRVDNQQVLLHHAQGVDLDDAAGDGAALLVDEVDAPVQFGDLALVSNARVSFLSNSAPI